MRFRLIIPLVWLAVVGGGTVALAHAMRVAVEVTAAEVRVEVKYDGADHGGEGPTVTLLRLPGKDIVDRKPADKMGVAVFAKPAPGTYLVSAEDEFHDMSKEIVVSEAEATYADAPPDRWRSIAVGLTAIAALTTAAWYFSRRNRRAAG